MRTLGLLIWTAIAAFISCNSKDNEVDTPSEITFGEPQLVTIQGYDDHAMEPFMSRDGSILFFNNSNAPTANTNLHWCTKIDDTYFQYQGELTNVNTESLEGVPTMDEANNFYFVHTGTYDETLSSIYSGQYSSGSITGFDLVENISKVIPGWLNFDVEVSNDGNTLYFVDGRYDQNGGPYEANLVIAKKDGDQFFRTDDSSEILQNVNTDELEYAAAISKDELVLCFTRVEEPLTASSEPQIFIATRSNTSQPFSSVTQLTTLTGFVEGPTFNSDDSGIYYHKKEGATHHLYYVEMD